jgi:hypothetical protein
LSSVLFIEQSPEQWVEWIPQRGAGFDDLGPAEFSVAPAFVQLRFGRAPMRPPEVMAPRGRYRLFQARSPDHASAHERPSPPSGARYRNISGSNVKKS